MKRRMRFGAASFALLSVLSGCSGAPRVSTGTAGSCADIVNYVGHEYVGATLSQDRIGLIPQVHRRPIGSGTRPGCRDTNHEPPATGERITIDHIDGVSPDIAIADADGAVYVRKGASVPAGLSTRPWIHWLIP